MAAAAAELTSKRRELYPPVDTYNTGMLKVSDIHTIYYEVRFPQHHAATTQYVSHPRCFLLRRRQETPRAFLSLLCMVALVAARVSACSACLSISAQTHWRAALHSGQVPAVLRR